VSDMEDFLVIRKFTIFTPLRLLRRNTKDLGSSKYERGKRNALRALFVSARDFNIDYMNPYVIPIHLYVSWL
jgi:hypothetical protein